MEDWKLSRFLSILKERNDQQHTHLNKFSFIGECDHVFTFDVTKPIQKYIFDRLPQGLKNAVLNNNLEIEDK